MRSWQSPTRRRCDFRPSPEKSSVLRHSHPPLHESASHSKPSSPIHSLETTSQDSSVCAVLRSSFGAALSSLQFSPRFHGLNFSWGESTRPCSLKPFIRTVSTHAPASWTLSFLRQSIGFWSFEVSVFLRGKVEVLAMALFAQEVTYRREGGSQTPPIPLDKLLSPSFLTLYDEELLSYSIWDHCAAKLEATHGGTYPAESVEDLLSALEPLLAPNIIDQIGVTLDALGTSVLGVETVLLPSLSSVLENILIDLENRASTATHGDDDRLGHAWVQVPQRQRRGQGGVARGQRGARGRAGGRQRVSLRVHGEGDGDDPLRREELVNAQFFKDVLQIYVEMDACTTPPKGNQEQRSARKVSIGERAEAFATHLEVARTHVPYSPYDTTGMACFYHGTRLSMSSGFFDVGILPMKFCTEFSFSPAFYVTNSVIAAFEFPLHNRLSMNPQDTVAVFGFEFDLRILHGEIAAPSGQIFRVRWFEVGVEDEAWKEFCESNLYGRKPKPQHSYDIVIGSMCLRNDRNHSITPRQMEGLVQVAFCSKAACTWAGSCLKRMFIEIRMNEVLEGM